MIKDVYIVLIVVLISASLIIERIIERKFFKQLNSVHLFFDRKFFATLFSPKYYFKKDSLLKGYFLYLLSIGLIIASVYFFIKFLEATS